tara:strand:+ start:173 stop:340 length:168 start_codon:yes stop_codon:yes gene_type:complete
MYKRLKTDHIVDANKCKIAATSKPVCSLALLKGKAERTFAMNSDERSPVLVRSLA